MAVPLCVEYQPDSSATAIDIFPLAGEDMAVTGQGCARWSMGITGNGLMVATSGCEECASEQERDIDVS
jgi:hypothetical protein